MLVLTGILALVLVFIIIFQIARASEFLSTLKDEGVVSKDSNRIIPALLLVFMVLFLGGVCISTYYYYPSFLGEASSIHGVQIDYMFNITLFFTGIVFILTHIALFWFAYKYRGKEGAVAHFFPHNNKLEVIWTAVPAVVLTFLVVKGIETWTDITNDPSEDAMVVEITGQQFNWIVRYPGDDAVLGPREFLSISPENQLGILWDDPTSHDDFIPTEIHLPVNKEVVFKLGAKDVLHSFYLPHFRVKMDCVPGIPSKFKMTPTKTTAEKREEMKDQGFEDFNYVLTCAELCGSSHWNMVVKVVVETEEEYNAWVAQQTPYYERVKSALNTTEEAETAVAEEGIAEAQ